MTALNFPMNIISYNSRQSFLDKYSEYGFFERLTMINKEFPGANMVMAKLGMMPQVGLYSLGDDLVFNNTSS